MNIKKCNKCGKILEDEDYFSIDEITFNKGDSTKRTVSVYVNDENIDEKFSREEGWVYYADLDFCEKCFKEENLYKFLKRR